MSVPIPGDIKVEFNRTYIVVNPDASLGPPTYRISNRGDTPMELDFVGDSPIDVTTTTNTTTRIITTSIDIEQLDDRGL